SLDVTARCLRLTMHPGDPAVSATEFAVFDTVPSTFPPKFPARPGHRPPLPGEDETLRFGVIAALALLLHRWNQPTWVRAVAIGAPIFFGYLAYSAVGTATLPEQPVIDMVRAVSAAVAAAAVLRL